MRGGASGGRRRLSAPATASLLLHAGAALALAAVHSAQRLPAATQEQGVEIVWQSSPEDSEPGEEATAPPEGAEQTSAEAQPQEPPATEPEQDLAEASSPLEAPPEADTPERSPPSEPPPPPPEPVLTGAFSPAANPEPALAEAPSLEAEPPPPPPPVEPPPTQNVETPPPPRPAEARVPPLPEEARPPDLPLPPPPPAPAPAPPRPASPRQQQVALVAAAPPRPTPPGPAAPPDTPGGSKAVGAVVPPGLLDGVRNPEPEYPFVSRQRGDQGVVAMRLGISATGQVMEVEVVATSGHPELDESARRAVQRWRFRPAMRDGVPVAGSIRTSIHFRL